MHSNISRTARTTRQVLIRVEDPTGRRRKTLTNTGEKVTIRVRRPSRPTQLRQALAEQLVVVR